MFNSLEIRNYRNLKNLRISTLARVNLITGKNNTGKSSLLEAIAIYANKGNSRFLYELLKERGEGYTELRKTVQVDINVKSLSGLFTNREVGFTIEDRISIGEIEDTLFGEQANVEKSISLRFVKFMEEELTDSLGNSRFRRVIVNNDDTNNTKIGFETRVNNALAKLIELPAPVFRNFDELIGECEFIRSRSIDKESNSKLWDAITLTDRENYVLDALRIIEPKIERIAFIDEDRKERMAVVKLKDTNSILPLRSMGDGINRILTIILALVNVENGFLLIDEFENGLHYSVQELLWKVIFILSERLNIQVFATTHSEDCISAFENILNSAIGLNSGKLLRLDNKNGTIQPMEFSADELKVANEYAIEIR